LLERLNKMATADFSDLTSKTRDAGASIQQIQDKAKEIQPCLDEIDVLEASSSELLNTAQLLDDYSKRVGELRNNTQFSGLSTYAASDVTSFLCC
jgi:hypothetical protein